MMWHVLIVEDVAETRSWLAGIASAAFPGCRIDEAASVRSGLHAAGQAAYDLALIDLGLPDGTGLEVLRLFKHEHPQTLCVVTTVMGDDTHIVAALGAGAQGYLLKEQPAEILSRQLRQLSNGIPALSPAVARRIMEHFRFTGPVSDNEGELTPREKEVLSLIARGLRNTDVAQALNITDSTVASYIKTIYRKLGISSRAEAAWHATRLGLTIPATEKN